ncbi:MAG: sigma-70 family RNA polymerase sigma factor [Planctomycetales bacterium]|nr:sigma-70 family RNA polymerase sigma factor [Planctomycetales bacterium]
MSNRPPTEWVAEVFARYEVSLVAYARGRLNGDVEEAKDVVQEAFVKLCQQRWPDIEAHVTAWLYRTCRNRAIDISRREGRMSSVHTGGTDVSEIRDQAARRPEDRASQDEQLLRMRNQMHQLPEQQQELLRLRLHDGLSYKQIAQVTGLTASNVGYLLHQAVTSLRLSMLAD